MISKVKLSAPATLIFSAIAIYKKKANKRKKLLHRQILDFEIGIAFYFFIF